MLHQFLILYKKNVEKDVEIFLEILKQPNALTDFRDIQNFAIGIFHSLKKLQM